jgi:hypothetical protein
VQNLKQKSEIVSTDEGMQIPWSDEHEANADWPKVAIAQPDSNDTSERFPQLSKQYLGIVSIDEGIQIDSSREHPEYAESSIVSILQPTSKVTFER